MQRVEESLSQDFPKSKKGCSNQQATMIFQRLSSKLIPTKRFPLVAQGLQIFHGLRRDEVVLMIVTEMK